MPRRREIDHFLLHFRLERDDITAPANVRRRCGVIVRAFEEASVDSQNALNYLIAQTTAIVGSGKPDADAIRGLANELKARGDAIPPTQLLGLVEGLERL